MFIKGLNVPWICAAWSPTFNGSTPPQIMVHWHFKSVVDSILEVNNITAIATNYRISEEEKADIAFKIVLKNY